MIRYVILYAILIGYKRITLFGVATLPFFCSIMGTHRLPTGAVADQFAYDNSELFFIIGIIWMPIYIFLGLRFERWVVFKIKEISINDRGQREDTQ